MESSLQPMPDICRNANATSKLLAGSPKTWWESSGRRGCHGANTYRRLSMARKRSADHFRAARHETGTTGIPGGLMKREYDFSKAKRGPVVSVPSGKTRVTIRLDEDILSWFRREV